MRLTLVYPAIGRKTGVDYMRSWQMEPLPIAALAGLTPPDVDIAFHDDRMEAIPFDRPADLAAIPVETYTAKRAYQIASEYRRRGVPVVMGGFHATLAPDEVSRYAEAIVVGEAENVYKSETQPDLSEIRYDRRLFTGKNYLPIRLIETGRGCKFPCDFCAIQTFFKRRARHRPIDAIVMELLELKDGARLFFFVDDNFAADIGFASELAEALEPLGLRWVTQMSINAAHDEALLARLKTAGCCGVLIGFESLDESVLRSMRKTFNTMKGGYPVALANLRRYGIRVYGTFVFGYGETRRESFAQAAEFAIDNRFYIAAFNHLTPFPGTPLYTRLAQEGRLLYENWWLDERYRYNDLPFRPEGGEPDDIRKGCLTARRRFYGWRSMALRVLDKVNRADPVMLRNFLPINIMHRAEVSMRDHFPLGDPTWQGRLLPIA
jgi:radical SAM superfamily enzyme YgiQ (UPF0313 family)